MAENDKTYLGDQVYVAHDGYHIVLTTHNGIADTNTIFLDPQVTQALLAWIEAQKRKA